jgi:hypothetical protein
MMKHLQRWEIGAAWRPDANQLDSVRVSVQLHWWRKKMRLSQSQGERVRCAAPDDYVDGAARMASPLPAHAAPSSMQVKRLSRPWGAVRARTCPCPLLEWLLRTK